MRYTIDTGFAVIKSNEPIPTDFIKHLNLGFKINKNIFKKNISKFNIIVCNDETEYKKYANQDYEKWATATVLKNKNLVVRIVSTDESYLVI